MRGAVFALSTKDGSKIWVFTVKDAEQMHSSPAVIDGVIYFGDYENDSDGSLYALGDSAGEATPAASPSPTQ
jgi:outer membrane protein assembly factor BamB